MRDILDDHLCEIVGRQVRQDGCVTKTLAGIFIASFAVSCFFVGIAGKLASSHLSDADVLRLSRGEFLDVAKLCPISPDSAGQVGARRKV